MKRKKLYLFFAVIVMAGICISYAKFFSKKSSAVETQEKIVISNQQNFSSLSEKLKNKDAFNILLLGYGGENHEGAYLTDSIMIAHVDPQNKTTVLLSIPRDIWVNIATNKTGGTNWKINAAYAVGLDDKKFPNKPEEYKEANNGAGNLAKKAVQFVTGLPIDRYIAADFSSFANAIDAIGGVDVQVDRTFDDFAYPIDGKENDPCITPSVTPSPFPSQIPLDTIPTVFPCRYEHLHFDQGIVHLDGTNALKFVRSRHAADNSGDFGRSSRQRNLVSALKKKMFSPFIIPKIIPLYNSLHNHVFTDISLDEMKTLFLSASDLGKYSVKSIPMTDQTLFNFGFSSDRQYILIPKSGEEDWNEVHDWISKEIIKAIHTETPIAK